MAVKYPGGIGSQSLQLNSVIGLIKSEDFENFAVDEPNGNGFEWGTLNNTSIISEPALPSNSVMQFHYAGNPDPATDSTAEQRFNIGSLQQEVWFRYKIFIPANYEHRDATTSDNNKGFFLLWGDTYVDQDVHMRMEFERTANIDESRIVMYARQNQTGPNTEIPIDSDGRVAANLLGIAQADLGQWVDIVVRAAISDALPATNGRCTLWKNDVLFCDFRDIDNSSAAEASSNAFNGGYILGWSNSGYNVDTDFYIDDFLIGTSADSIGFVE